MSDVSVAAGGLAPGPAALPPVAAAARTVGTVIYVNAALGRTADAGPVAVAPPPAGPAAGSIPCLCLVVPAHELFDDAAAGREASNSISYTVFRDATTGCVDYDVPAGAPLVTLPAVARMLTRRTACTLWLPEGSTHPIKLDMRFAVNGVGGFRARANLTSLAGLAGAQPLSAWLYLLADACAGARTPAALPDATALSPADDHGIAAAIVRGIYGLLNSSALQRQVVRGMALTYSLHNQLGMQAGAYTLRVADIAGVPFVFQVDLRGLSFPTPVGGLVTLESPIPLRLYVANPVCVLPGGGGEEAPGAARVWIWMRATAGPATGAAAGAPRASVHRLCRRFTCLPADVRRDQQVVVSCACAHHVCVRLNDAPVLADSDPPCISGTDEHDCNTDGDAPVRSVRVPGRPLVVGENMLCIDVTVISPEFPPGLAARLQCQGPGEPFAVETDAAWVWSRLK